MGVANPLFESARIGDSGVSPYGVVLMMAAGFLVSTVICLPFFLAFPASGEALSFHRYFAGTIRQHLIGALAGAVFLAGALAYYVALTAPPAVRLLPSVSYSLLQAQTLLAVLWGLLIWRESKEATERVRALQAVMLVLFAAGIAMVALAPLYGSR